MESDDRPSSSQQVPVPEELPPLLTKEIHGFDSIENSKSREAAITLDRSLNDAANESDRIRPVSVFSIPPSPLGSNSQTPKKVYFDDNPQDMSSTKIVPHGSPPFETAPEAKFYSQPMPRGVTYVEGSAPGPNAFKYSGPQARNPHIERLKDARFNSFKTWSGKLERQLSQFGGKPATPKQEVRPQDRIQGEALPADRYFDALDGPELDTLRPSEELMLPNDKSWPFLLRFPIASFGICLGVSSQAILYKTLANSTSIRFLNVSPWVNFVLWTISVALVVVIALIYSLKMFFYFEAVRREYYHPIRVNFFFAPFISLLFLSLGCPPLVTEKLPPALWYVLMFPILCLELKIYGQWMSGGQRRLSKVANPVNYLAIVGNFVGALLGASMGLKEGPIFFFSIGLAHYIVLFVTLYQRLPTNKTLPKELHPVFFLFIAAPSVASMAWARIEGSYNFGSRIAYFIALFLLGSLAVRINFFRGFTFSISWWAYTFPMTAIAIATIRYSNEVSNWLTKTLSVILTILSTLIVTALLVSTLLHAFVFRNLFPNDIAIAISDKPARPRKKWFSHFRHGSSDTNDIERYLKFVNCEGHDLESSNDPSTTHEKDISESV